MTPIYKLQISSKIRLYNLYSLIFFALILPASCKQNNREEISIVWNNKQPVAFSIPKKLLNVDSDDSIEFLLQVHVTNSNTVAMLGDYNMQDENVIFTPPIPFTKGLHYGIYFRKKLLSKINIPLADSADAPVLVKVYPTGDTLPENLLKIYLQFSKAMSEGESQKYIALLDDNQDTLPGVFLDLQPELWNEERTILTLWLDPGRIKRDLIPNQKLGNPLKNGVHYTLAISGDWKGAQGLRLQQAYRKKIIVGPRDGTSPDVQEWMFNLPPAQTNQPLQINLGEALDYFLLEETIKIADMNNKIVGGKIQISNNETVLQFTPNNKWQPGHYTLQIQSILEDLAGNNLNSPFDRDIKPGRLTADKQIFERKFEIKD